MYTAKIIIKYLPNSTTLDESLPTSTVHVLPTARICRHDKLSVLSGTLPLPQGGLQLGPVRAVHLLGVVAHTLGHGQHQPYGAELVELLSLE